MTWKYDEWVDAHYKGKTFKVKFSKDGRIEFKNVDDDTIDGWMRDVVIPAIEKGKDHESQ